MLLGNDQCAIDAVAGDHVQCEGVGSGGEGGDDTVGSEEVTEFGVDQALQRVFDNRIAQDLDDRSPDLGTHRLTKRSAAEQTRDVLGDDVVQPRLNIRIAEESADQRRQLGVQCGKPPIVGQQCLDRIADG